MARAPRSREAGEKSAAATSRPSPVRAAMLTLLAVVCAALTLAG